MIRCSIIVPTYNRADLLQRALRSFLQQDIDPGEYEILVVDNNSTDHTGLAVAQAMSEAACSWKYIVETRQGLHYARNRGIIESRGEVVVFGDEDIAANESWLSEILREFDCHPETGVSGGKVLPLWNGEPPDWIYDYGNEWLHPLFAYLDYGDQRLVLEHEYVFGCNFAIRRSIALAIGGSCPDTYPRKWKHLSGTGESAMIDSTRKLGYHAVYLPQAYVYHCADAARATLAYFIDRYERWAVEDVFHAFRHDSRKEAVKRLLRLAFGRLEQLPAESRIKINPDYYGAIHRRWAQYLVQQTFRVLNEPSLYAHITKESYLTEE